MNALDPLSLVTYALAVVGALSIIWFVAHHGATVVTNAWHAAQVAGTVTAGAAGVATSTITADFIAVKNDVTTTKNQLQSSINTHAAAITAHASDIATLKVDVAALKVKAGI
jgi:hypothetical protein